jgi:alkylation response protein AidB-like acyl-CoA dehydrogenase
MMPLPARELADLAEDADRLPGWPAASWALLREAGGLRWSIPPALGGLGLDPLDQLRGHEALASA